MQNCHCARNETPKVTLGLGKVLSRRCNVSVCLDEN